MPLVGVRHPNACESQSLAPTQALLLDLLILSLVSHGSLASISSLVIAQGTKVSSEWIRFFLVVSAIPTVWERFSNVSKRAGKERQVP